MSKFVVRILLCLLMALALSNFVLIAQESEGDHPVIVATADGITLPENLVAGMTTLVFQNDTEADFSPILLRLNDGVEMADFMTAMQAGSPDAVLEVASVIGSPHTSAGQSHEATYDLLAGNYLLLAFAPDAPPNMLPFTVAESEAAAAETPEAAVTVTMVDFAFGISSGIVTGDQTWKIENLGEQIHEMVIFRVGDDAELSGILDEFVEVVHNAPPGAMPEFPYETVYTWSAMSPDREAWPTVNLEPGKYAVLCFVPDATGAPDTIISHLEHGMLRLITVGE